MVERADDASRRTTRTDKRDDSIDANKEGRSSSRRNTIGAAAAPPTASTDSPTGPKRSREKTTSANNRDKEEMEGKQVAKKSKVKDTPTSSAATKASKKVESIVNLKKGDEAVKIFVDVLTWYCSKEECEYPLKDKKQNLSWYVEGIVEVRSKPGVYYVKFPIFDEKTWIWKPLKYFEEDFVFMEKPSGSNERVITEKDRIKYEGS